DEAVAGFLRDLLGGVEQPRRRSAEIDLAGAAARHLRHFAERGFDGGKRLARLAAGTVDQAGGEALRIVEQHLEDVLGGELLVPLAQGKGLGGLDKSARAFGVFLDVHQWLPRAPKAPGLRTSVEHPPRK